jgi:hypothetical protein
MQSLLKSRRGVEDDYAYGGTGILGLRFSEPRFAG